ncbi:MAG: hypothetical protein OXG04_18350 [Acidobacteria bacterium]|nr:hypothetical protein [Acidobacteriota bacterium]
MPKVGFVLAVLVSLITGMPDMGLSQAQPAPPPSWACDDLVSSDDPTYGIIGEIFYGSTRRLQSDGLLPDGFAETTANAGFHVCNNRSYDTYVLYTNPPVVIYDLQMVGFMFAQARAMILGQYVSERVSDAGTFDLHEKLIHEFATQSDALDSDILEIMTREANRLGVADEFLADTLQDSEYRRREQITFLHAVNFLTLHELCHVFLEHGTEEAARRWSQALELDADKCALDIINRDEARFMFAPASFFGALMIISTQMVVNEVTGNAGEQHHPSTRARLQHAGNVVLDYLAASRSPDTDRYVSTIEGTLSYLGNLITRYLTR